MKRKDRTRKANLPPASTLVGKTQGLWTVLAVAKTRRTGPYVLCRCACGKEREIYAYTIHTGKNLGCQSCRSHRRRTSKSLMGSDLYSTWANMMSRCHSPTNRKWNYYGGRGITVCERWHSSENFIKDMSPRPSSKHSLDRIDNNKGYSPENCRWATHRVQCRNKRNNKIITFEGVERPLWEWAEKLNISPKTIKSRLRLGWCAERALSTPVDANCGRYDRRNVAMRRKKISASARLATLLCTLVRPDGTKLIPDEVKAKGVKAILAHVEWDHIVPVAFGGDNHPTNLQPLSKEEHAAKTSIDVKNIAKSKRISKDHEEFRRRILAKAGQGEPPASRKFKRKWPSRPFASRQRGMSR